MSAEGKSGPAPELPRNLACAISLASRGLQAVDRRPAALVFKPDRRKALALVRQVDAVTATLFTYDRLTGTAKVGAAVRFVLPLAGGRVQEHSVKSLASLLDSSSDCVNVFCGVLNSQRLDELLSGHAAEGWDQGSVDIFVVLSKYSTLHSWEIAIGQAIKWILVG